MRTLLVGFVAAVATGCASSPSGSGEIHGQLPLCFGPGPSTNLVPRVTLEVLRGHTVVTTRIFATDRAHHSYQLTLPSGKYDLRLTNHPETRLRVEVRKGRIAQADFPELGCL